MDRENSCEGMQPFAPKTSRVQSVLTLYSLMEHSLGVNFFSPPSPHVMRYFSSIPCLPVLSTPLSYVCCVCMDRLMANFAGTCD